jgi:hypothetical protein
MYKGRIENRSAPRNRLNGNKIGFTILINNKINKYYLLYFKGYMKLYNDSMYTKINKYI